MTRRPVTPALLKVSAAVHAMAALGTLAVPGLWPWALGALVSNHAALTLAGLLPRAHWLGPNISRLPAAAIARNRWHSPWTTGPTPR